jgi:hypothetical protein
LFIVAGLEEMRYSNVAEGCTGITVLGMEILGKSGKGN